MRTSQRSIQASGSAVRGGQLTPKAAGMLVAAIFAVTAIIFSAQLRAEPPSAGTMATAVWMHALKCSWKLDGEPVPGLGSKADIAVETIKWLPAENAAEFTLRFIKSPPLTAANLGDYKQNKEWIYSGKWKLQSSGIIGFRKWSVSDAPASYTPTAREPTNPFIRPTVERK
jgi:hypothetical protein